MKEKKYMPRKEGNITLHIVVSLGALVIVGMVMVYAAKLRMLDRSRSQMEDSIATSCLASLLIDMQHYSQTGYLGGNDNADEEYHPSIGDAYEMGEMIVTDVQGAYNMFLNTLASNADTLDHMTKELYDQVKVQSYILYNVKRRKIGTSSVTYVEINQFDDAGLLTRSEGAYGEITDPTGKVIHKTSAYADVRFQVKDLQGNPVQVHQELTVQAEER